MAGGGDNFLPAIIAHNLPSYRTPSRHFRIDISVGYYWKTEGAKQCNAIGSGDICQIYATFSVGACDIGCIVGVDDQSMVGFE